MNEGVGPHIIENHCSLTHSPSRSSTLPSAPLLPRNICRGLFERHKLLFSSLICFQILRHRREIPREEWAFFLRGPGPVDRSSQPPNPCPSRLSPVQWDLLFAAEQRAVAPSPSSESAHSQTNSSEGQKEEAGDEGGEDPDGVSPLLDLCVSVGEHWDDWVAWADGGDVWDESRVPGDFFSVGNSAGGVGSKVDGERGRATAFQRLLLVKAFREDQLLRCIANFVGEKLGPSFAERWVAVGECARHSP